MYEWVDRSINGRNKLKHFLYDINEGDYAVVLQIHAVWWLSRGNDMTCLLEYMPSLLDLFRFEKLHQYEIMYSFKSNFLRKFACICFIRVK